MQNIPIATSCGALSATGGFGAAGRGRNTRDGFRDLLAEAFQNTARTVRDDRQPKQAEQRKTEQEAGAKAPAESRPTDAAAADAAAAAATPEAVPQPVTESGEATETVVPGRTTAEDPVFPARNVIHVQVPAMAEDVAAPDEEGAENPSTRQGGGILSMETAVTRAAETEAVPAQVQAKAQLPGATPEADRFGSMLGQARQQLQDIATQGQAATPTEPAATEPNPEASVDIPGQTEPEPEDVTGPEAGLPLEEAGTPAEETPGEPAGAEFEPEPEPRNADRPTPQQQTQVKPSDQRILTEMPEADRTVLKMLDETVRAAEQQPTGPYQPQREIENGQPQAPRQASQPQQPQQQARADQTDQIRVQVQENLQSGRTEFHMQLRPEELGKVSVRMVIDGGRLAVEIIASGERTAELLNRQAEALGLTLRNHTGMEVTSVSVVNEASSASGNMESAFSQGPQAENGGQGQSQGGRSSGYTGREQDDESGLTERREPTAPKTLLNTTA